MRKHLPMSALITGLLAAPVLGATGLSVPGSAAPMVETLVETFPAQMPADIGERMRRIARGEKLNAFGMQGLTGRITRLVQQRVAGRRGAAVYPSEPLDVLVPAQLVQAAPTPGTHVEKLAYLGVAPSLVPEALGAQLNLPRGMGLVIDFIDPGSPADKAGLQKNDVLQKLDDQWLVNAGQMQVLVRAKKAGETVTFSVIRGGKAADVKVTLSEKEVLVANPEQAMPAPAGGLALPPGVAVPVPGGETVRRFSASSMTMNGDGSTTRRLRDEESDITVTRDKDGRTAVSVKDAEGRVIYEGAADGASKALSPSLLGKVNSLLNAPAEVHVDLQPGDGGVPAVPGTARTRSFMLDRNDSVHNIAIRVNGEGRHLTVTEVGGGKVIFDGPANTDDDLKALPAPVLEKVKAALEKVK